MKRSEDTEQIQVIQWATWHERKYPELKWLHHIPNGGKRSKSEAQRFKAMGVKAGVSDLYLPYPKGGYTGLYIEMKYGKNRLTDCQKEFIKDMQETGKKIVVCYSAEEAIKELETYLNLPIDRVVSGINKVIREMNEKHANETSQ